MRILSSTSKPITSPGRTEKFPPPLMRFLRSNVGSRSSRGRTTKSNLLFLRRNKKAIASSNANETQEPTSPKVTCMGQVRVRRSRSSKSSQKASKIEKKEENPGKRCKCSCCCCGCSCCCWLQKPSLCGLKIWSWRSPGCSKWFSFLNCRSLRVRTDSSKFGSNRFEPAVADTATATMFTAVVTAGIAEAATAAGIETAHSSTPPRNALSLMRCTSAPSRSTSLVCQIMGEKTEEEAENKALGIELSSSSCRSSDSSSRDSTSKSRGNLDVIGSCAKISLRKDFGNCADDDFEHEQQKILTTCTTSSFVNSNNNGSNSKDHGEVEVEEVGEIQIRKLVLMRSKSEPGRSEREMYDPVSSEFWKHRRSTPNSNVDAID